ncbi:Uncharacterised protein [Aeromonas salmonicida]|nr:Uncharacterised protein [Aeromonas salmonicida]
MKSSLREVKNGGRLPAVIIIGNGQLTPSRPACLQGGRSKELPPITKGVQGIGLATIS